MSNIFKTLVVITLISGTAFAEVAPEKRNIIIKDCEGNTQLVESIDSNSVIIKATADVDSLANDSKAIFTNVSISKEIKKDLTSKEVEIDNVTAGEWKLCAEPQKVSFKDISIVKNDSGSTSLLAAVGASAAGALAIVAGNSDSNSSNSGNLNSAGASSVVSKDPTLTEAARKKPTTQADEDDEDDCFIGEDDDIEPISVFN